MQDFMTRCSKMTNILHVVLPKVKMLAGGVGGSCTADGDGAVSTFVPSKRALSTSAAASESGWLGVSSSSAAALSASMSAALPHGNGLVGRRIFGKSV